MSPSRSATWTLLTLVWLSPAAAQTPQRLAEDYLRRVPAQPLAGEPSLADARAAQEELVRLLAPELGPPVGYKAALTSAAAQQRFGVGEPLRGTLLKKMLLPSGSVLPADFGSRPLCEADLVVRVGDAAINEATTESEALAALDAVYPFLELPDLVYAEGTAMDAAALAAINVGARAGILGEAILLTPTLAWERRLASFRVQLLGEEYTPPVEGGGSEPPAEGEDTPQPAERDDAELLAEGSGKALLGHPLRAVLWLRDSLAAEGRRLAAGDLLSLGSLTVPMPARPGTVVRARYLGLDPSGAVEISAAIEAPP